MIPICPLPKIWHEIHQQLSKYAENHKCHPLLPPKPLILAGWAYSNDIEKKNRWQETVHWATKNGCIELVTGIPDSDFYIVEKPTKGSIGPMGDEI